MDPYTLNLAGEKHVESIQESYYPLGLRQRNFQKISSSGIGDPLNAYTHAMAWFNGHLYVGTTRANIHLVWFTMGENVNRFECWPVEVPDNPFDLDIRAQIWRYNPQTQKWRNCFVSPMVMGKEGIEVPMTIGFRSITPFQGKSDPDPVLYVPTWSSSKGPGPVLMRSEDGINFESVSEPGLGDPSVSTFRSLATFNGKFFISPTGTARGQFSGNVPDKLIIFVSDDPVKGNWQLACEPHFGDMTNLGIFDMTPFNGYLYVGTFNTEGCQVWKTDAEGEPPYKWKRVLTHGGYRGKENQAVMHMTEFKGRLYVGTGIMGGYDRVRNIGPASPELFCLYPDDSWDLVVGEPRITPEGLKVPLSGMQSGFDSPTVGYFWRMCVYEGWLYLGTYDWTVWLPYVHKSEWPERVLRSVERIGIDNLIKKRAGFDLWRTKDGRYWTSITRNGFDNPCNYGIRTMISSPYGLFIGTANPFGPAKAVLRTSGWQYTSNPHGGIEIWMGSSAFHTISSHPVSSESSQDSTSGPGQKYRDLGELAKGLIYDYFEQTDFCQCGLWRYPTQTPREACEDLVEELLSFIPERQGPVLQIGCGWGETTRIILRDFSPEAFTGVVETREELEACKEKIPDARFRIARSSRLNFREESFRYVICIEGPGFFVSDKKFFHTVYRILKPGGQLLFSDIIFDTVAANAKNGHTKNMAETTEEYKKLLIRCGFESAEIFNVTDLCWRPFHDYFWNHFGLDFLRGKISPDLYKEISARLPSRGLPVSYYIIGSVAKGPRKGEKGS
jgi:cyclopropane fatty-acyl-phospholipid synthase-like methyltransferase